MTDIQELNAELIRLSHGLDEAQANLVSAVKAEAESERDYRLARSIAYLKTQGTVAEREAIVDKELFDTRYHAQVSAGLAKAALEAVRNHRSQMSALQTIAGAAKEELKLARTGTEPRSW